MTQEFKEALLQYLIGELPENTGLNEPQPQAQQEITNNYQQFVQENITDGNFRANGYIQAGNSGKILIYGSVMILGESESFTYQGALIILDENLQPVQALTEFNTGTKFREFTMLKVAEDNTIYGVDNDYSFDGNTGTNIYRFIMLNDILSSSTISDSYQAILRQSYNFPTNYNKLFFGYSSDKQYRIWKKPNASSYIFIGRDDSNNFATTILQLTVNVGSENEWVTYSNSLGIASSEISSFISQWNDDDLILKIAGFYEKTQAGQLPKYIELTLQNGQLTQTFSNDVNAPISSIALINDTTAYYSIENNDYDNNTVTLEIWKVDYNNNNANIIYSRTDPYVYLGNIIYLSVCNNIVFAKIVIDKQIGNQYYDDNYLGMIFNDNLYLAHVGETALVPGLGNLFFIKNEFNLYTVSTQASNVLQSVKINFNSLNYNGQSYLNNNALISNSAELYSNNSLVFARNLYNKSLNNNTTVATVEVPNNYLNDIDITSKNLLSETNLDLVEDTNMIQKNVYETLYINFINTLLIADMNNTTQVLNQQASTYLNSQINDDEGYSKAQIYPKVVITYQDNSTKEIAGEYQNIEDTSADIVFALYVDQSIQSAEIVSNDKSTIYQTINLTNLEQDKYYVIRQNLKVI